MAFDNTKYDIELNGVGHRIVGYKKSEANPFVPRLGGGDQTESQFDLLRSKTIEGFAGGILQKQWKDDNAVFGSRGLFPFYGGDVLYPADALAVSNTLMTGAVLILDYVRNKDSMWILYSDYDSSPGQKMVRLDASGANGLSATQITLPNPLSGYTSSGCLCLHDNKIWLSCWTVSATGSLWYMGLNDTSFTEVSGGTKRGMSRMVSYKGKIYGLKGTGDSDITRSESILYRYDGDTSNQSGTDVGQVPSPCFDPYAKLFVFNNTIRLTRFDGHYQYDTVTFSAVDDLNDSANNRNWRFPCVLQGYIYYMMPDGLYRMSTAGLIEKLYDVGYMGYPADMHVSDGKLWILHSVSSYAQDYSNPQHDTTSIYDKAMGFDYSSGTNRAGRVDVFDGLSMYTWGYTTTQTDNVAGRQNLPEWLLHFNKNLLVYALNSVNNSYWIAKTDAPVTGDPFTIVTSVFDGDFPQLDKSLENLQIILDDATSSSTIAVEYRTTGFDSASGWTSLGNIVPSTSTIRYIFQQIAAGLSFRRIQFRFSTSSISPAAFGLAKIVIRYSLMPDPKNEWQFTILAYGDEEIEPLLLRDGSHDTQSVSTLRENVYASRNSAVPVIFCDVDCLNLNGSHTNSVTTITLDSTALLRSRGFIKVDNEIIYYTGKTSTTLTGCTRGMLGTSAASHSDDAKVFPTYRAVLRQIANERMEMTDKDLDSDANKARPSELTVLIQEQ